jgi:hypothetical protein
MAGVSTKKLKVIAQCRPQTIDVVSIHAERADSG